MKPHKWAKEIKAWADGAEIEYHAKNQEDEPWMPFDGRWTNNETWEYRIKPQPKEPQYLYVFKDEDDFQLFITDGSVSSRSREKYIGKIKLEDE
jgi:hypothetical protein